MMTYVDKEYKWFANNVGTLYNKYGDVYVKTQLLKRKFLSN